MSIPAELYVGSPDFDEAYNTNREELTGILGFDPEIPPSKAAKSIKTAVRKISRGDFSPFERYANLVYAQIVKEENLEGNPEPIHGDPDSLKQHHIGIHWAYGMDHYILTYLTNQGGD